MRDGAPVRVTAKGEGQTIEFEAVPQLLTEAERALIASGGILMHVLNAFSPASGGSNGMGK